MKYINEFRDGKTARVIAAAIAAETRADRRYHIMEFCGGHTHAISRYGLSDLLPENIRLIHGPGCPVCVLPIGRIDNAIDLALNQKVILATYGDCLRVPASGGLSLLKAKARGADVRMVYSSADAVRIARENPAREVVFFESLFKASKWTWLFGWLFHAALLLVLLRHLRYFQQPVWTPIVWVQAFGMYAGFAMALGLAGLWARRFLVDRVRYISTPSDHLHLALLLAIGLSGLGMRFVAPTDIVAVKAFMLGLARRETRLTGPAAGRPGVAAAPDPRRSADADLSDQQVAARAGPVLQPDAQPGRHLARGASPRGVGFGVRQAIDPL